MIKKRMISILLFIFVEIIILNSCAKNIDNQNLSNKNDNTINTNNNKQIQNELPKEKELEVTVEGITEKRKALLTTSDLGYNIYVFPIFTFTAEEPGKDVIFANIDDSYFVRIEKIIDPIIVKQQYENAIFELKEIGEIKELKGEIINDQFFRNADFYLTANNNQLTKEIILIKINNNFFKFTLFEPHKEPSEGIIPSFYAMLKSITVK